MPINFQGKCLSLDDQIDLFQRTVKSSLPNHFEGPNELMGYLSKSIFVVCIGSNDYMSNYLSDTSKHNTPQEFAHLLLDKLSQHFQVSLSITLNFQSVLRSQISLLIVNQYSLLGAHFFIYLNIYIYL